MKDETIRQQAESYINGNIAEFKQFLKRCSKLDLLNVIETLQSLGMDRHNSINRIRLLLEASWVWHKPNR